ncbi:MAG: cupin domain-containing protein [Oscillospiraceae bacterium]|jgi:uncharacterized cupin superfamily protein|nr:cupin domain-containing protein [Oscillospiraceae bacterium]
MEIIVRQPTEGEIRYMKREAVWECGVSEFAWRYDRDEICLILEGQAVVSYDGGSASFGAGDLVFFPKMDCVWKVLAPIKKHYR